MHLIGRKRYHAWSASLTVGLGIHTDGWSGFIDNPVDASEIRLYDLCEFDGELTAIPAGSPEGSFFGRDVNSLFTVAATWTPKGGPGGQRAGFCGRRLVSTWTDRTMLVLDKVVGDPSRFGVADEKGRSAMVYDVYENLGELREIRVGPPEDEAYGQTLNYVFQMQEWLAKGEGYGFPLPRSVGHAAS